MQQLVTPLLYKNMEIFEEHLNSGLLKTIEAGHPGLPQVRNLYIKSFQPWNFGEPHHGASLQSRVLDCLVHAIPRDSLTRFEYDTIYDRGRKRLPNLRVRVPHDTRDYASLYFALRHRQAKVCNYQHLGGAEKCLSRSTIAFSGDKLAHVTSVQVFVHAYYYDDIDLVSSIFACTPALRSLDLELGMPDLFDDGECCDSAIDVAQRMFHHESKMVQPIRLKSLRMTSMCFRLVSRMLTTNLDLKDLKHLQLISCTEIDPFLHEIQPLGLHLSSLCIAFPEQEDMDYRALPNFIRSLKPLKRLTLDYSGIDLYEDCETLRPHYSSLESLRVDDDPRQGPMMSIFEPAPNLDQLALSGFNLEDDWLPAGSAPFYDVHDLLVRAGYVRASCSSY